MKHRMSLSHAIAAKKEEDRKKKLWTTGELAPPSFTYTPPSEHVEQQNESPTLDHIETDEEVPHFDDGGQVLIDNSPQPTSTPSPSSTPDGDSYRKKAIKSIQDAFKIKKNYAEGGEVSKPTFGAMLKSRRIK